MHRVSRCQNGCCLSGFSYKRFHFEPEPKRKGFETVLPSDLFFLQLQAQCERGLPVLPGPWLEMQASFLLELMLHQCRTEYEFRKLLELLAEAGTALLQGKDVSLLFSGAALGQHGWGLGALGSLPDVRWQHRAC